MKTNLFRFSVAAGLVLATGFNHDARGCGFREPDSPETLARQAVSPDQTVATAAIAKLRAQGPAGLEALLEANGVLVGQYKANPQRFRDEKDQAEWNAVASALNAVSGQCDAYASGLFWYTDFEKAKAAAQTRGKPILSLRLLGKLDQEYSCANSRFFRTTLYPNSEVSKYLREHFILHWQSVRPVPRLTIDFGDGRKLERTITGNSVHYVLDSRGAPIDALPGLYGPKAFLKGLAKAEEAAWTYARLDNDAKPEYLRQYHRNCGAEIVKQWNTDMAKLGTAPNYASGFEPLLRTSASPSAQLAGRLAFSKSAIESPVLSSFQSRSTKTSAAPDGVLDDIWARLAALHADDAQLDTVTRAVVSSKSATAVKASAVAVSKRLVENPFMRTWLNLQRSIAEDTVRNEFLLHARFHSWFVQGVAPRDLAGLNAKVYAELFLMPESDPWLGLAPANTFTALPNDGFEQTQP